MSKHRHDMQNLSALSDLQDLRCLVAEQLEGKAFRHLRAQEVTRDKAKFAVVEAVSDWDNFWIDEARDARWLSLLGRRISDRETELNASYDGVSQARIELNEAIQKHTQQRDCKADLSKRLRRKCRSWHMSREEAMRASIPNKRAKIS